MSKYQFRLETLRRLRIAHRDQQRSALADGYRAEEILAERAAELADEQDRYLDVNQLVEVQRYETVLKTNEQQLAEQSTRLAIEVERRRQAVIEADRAVRVLDKLDEQHRDQHRRKAQRQETKQLDEVAITQWQR